MVHLEFTSGKLRYCLTGSVLTVFDNNGNKIWHKFFESVEIARKTFLSLR